MSKVIALSGWKGSGKDAIAGFLIKEFNFRRLAFADVLKEMVADQYNIDVDACHDPNQKESPLVQYPVITNDLFTETIHNFMSREFAKINREFYWTPRALCILEGSVKRSVNSQYWVQRVVDAAKNTNDNIVITDMRYKSELEQLREAFGDNLSSVRIERHSESPSSDPSERDLDNATFDFVLDNTGTLERAFMNIESFIHGLD